MKTVIPIGKRAIKSAALIFGAMALSSSTFAAGVNSHGIRCADLQRLIATTGFVFIDNPGFKDFAIANVSYCSGGGSTRVQVRSVPTIDNPECLIHYCLTTRMGN